MNPHKSKEIQKKLHEITFTIHLQMSGTVKTQYSSKFIMRFLSDSKHKTFCFVLSLMLGFEGDPWKFENNILYIVIH